jgi:hypothetical protein
MLKWVGHTGAESSQGETETYTKCHNISRDKNTFAKPWHVQKHSLMSSWK